MKLPRYRSSRTSFRSKYKQELSTRPRHRQRILARFRLRRLTNLERTSFWIKTSSLSYFQRSKCSTLNFNFKQDQTPHSFNYKEITKRLTLNQSKNLISKCHLKKLIAHKCIKMLRTKFRDRYLALIMGEETVDQEAPS